MKNIKNLAQIGVNSFHTVKCDKDRQPNEFFYLKNDDAPQWVIDMAKEVHGDMLPDDYKYAYIVDALEALAEADDVDNARSIIHDSVDIETYRLFHWVQSHTERLGRANDASDEFVLDTIEGFLTAGQYIERDEVFTIVLDTLENLAN